MSTPNVVGSEELSKEARRSRSFIVLFAPMALFIYSVVFAQSISPPSDELVHNIVDTRQDVSYMEEAIQRMDDIAIPLEERRDRERATAYELAKERTVALDSIDQHRAEVNEIESRIEARQDALNSDEVALRLYQAARKVAELAQGSFQDRIDPTDPNQAPNRLIGFVANPYGNVHVQGAVEGFRLLYDVEAVLKPIGEAGEVSSVGQTAAIELMDGTDLMDIAALRRAEIALDQAVDRADQLYRESELHSAAAGGLQGQINEARKNGVQLHLDYIAAVNRLEDLNVQAGVSRTLFVAATAKAASETLRQQQAQDARDKIRTQQNFSVARAIHAGTTPGSPTTGTGTPTTAISGGSKGPDAANTGVLKFERDLNADEPKQH